jgi:hypothetical protein
VQLASVRILRLALGVGLALWFSQAVGWTLSFIAPVISAMLLTQPMPAPSLKTGVGLVLAIVLALQGGLLLLPPLLNQPMVGILLLLLALYWSFYFTARGGAEIIGTLATVGIAISTAIGTVNLDAVLIVVSGITFAVCAAILFVWLAHALLPDTIAAAGTQPAAKAASAAAPDPGEARRSAFRSTLIVAPIALWFVFSSASAANIPVLIKVAAMGQQASNGDTRLAARSLLASTLIGGAGAIVGWQVLSIAPTLALYTLFVALAALLLGPRIFQGHALHPQSATWSYGLLTMIVILAPAVMDSMGGAPAGLKFLDRLLMFAGATLYAVGTVYLFDALAPARASANARAPQTGV